jgi:hypothetical protein
VNAGAIHPGGIPPVTERRIGERMKELLAANAEALAQAGMFKRARLKNALADQAFQEVTGSQRAAWQAAKLGGSGIH